MSSETVLQHKWPVLGRHERAAEWLQVWTDLGRAPRTIDAYARGLAEYLAICDRTGVDPLLANRAHIAVYVRELTSRPSHRGGDGSVGVGRGVHPLDLCLVIKRQQVDAVEEVQHVALIDRDAADENGRPGLERSATTASTRLRAHTH